MRAFASFCLSPSVSLGSLDKQIVSFGRASLLVLSALAMSSVASARTGAGAGTDATGNFKSEMAACARGDTPQTRENCITEARRAEAARRAGKLQNYGAQFDANALKRCDVFKAPDDRAACVARIKESNIDGSVASGGILRESVTTVIIPGGTYMKPMPEAMPMPMPEVMPMPMPGSMPMQKQMPGMPQ